MFELSKLGVRFLQGPAFGKILTKVASKWKVAMRVPIKVVAEEEPDLPAVCKNDKVPWDGEREWRL